MPRFIDADEALRQLENNRKDNPYQAPYRGVWDRAMVCAINTIESIPTTEVVEVKYGEKERRVCKYERYAEACGSWCMLKHECVSTMSGYTGLCDNCPEVGADMRGENDNEPRCNALS